MTDEQVVAQLETLKSVLKEGTDFYSAVDRAVGVMKGVQTDVTEQESTQYVSSAYIKCPTCGLLVSLGVEYLGVHGAFYRCSVCGDAIYLK